MDTVVGYVRCSTSEQADSGLGLDAQRQRLEQEADRRGWDLVIVEDRGQSAKSMDRPGIERALGVVSRGEASALIVAKLDRLSRSLLDFAALMERAKREGWALIALDLGVDTSTATGELIANVLMSVAQWERRAIGERTRDALAAARARGQRLGRPRSVPDELRARIVSERASGATLQAIANRLNEEQIPTARGGLCWQRGTVGALLKSGDPVIR